MVISNEARHTLVDQTRLAAPEHIQSYPHIIVCGPSGSGKTTITRTDPNSIMMIKPEIYSFSTSGCTRKLRDDEVDGRDYRNMSIADFGVNDFFETNEYTGNKKLYGTLVSEIERIALYEKKRIIFDIDPNGAKIIQEFFAQDVLSAFLNTSDKALWSRLKKRAIRTGESDDMIKKRIAAAGRERRMVESGEFVPDIIIPYDTMSAGEAVNLILFKAQQKMLRNKQK